MPGFDSLWPARYNAVVPKITTPQEIFDAMPARFDPVQAGDINTIVQFDLSGPAGGQWYATVANRQLSVQTGAAPTSNITINVSAENFLAMANGELKPMSAFMQGKVRVLGNAGLLMKLQSLFS